MQKERLNEVRPFCTNEDFLGEEREEEKQALSIARPAMGPVILSLCGPVGNSSSV